jgi:ABC-2 type transport system ATP-binding protein
MLAADTLTKTFGARVAVEGVSFDVAAGEIFALVGPNGAGKTTTLRMLAGLIAPSSGTVRFRGEPMAGAAAALRAAIGLLTEAPGLWDRLTVRQNLHVHARLHGLSRPEHAVDMAMDLFGIADRATDIPAVLSKGLRQRVALARTLLHDPAVVLLDEPTSGLDPESASDVRELVVRLRHDRRAVIISTHNLDEVDRLADRVALLNTRLVAVDSPGSLRTRAFGTRVRITLSTAGAEYGAALRATGAGDVREDGRTLSIGLEPDGPPIPALVRALVQAGAGVEAVEREEASLEQVYLRMIKDERP